MYLRRDLISPSSFYGMVVVGFRLLGTVGVDCIVINKARACCDRERRSCTTDIPTLALCEHANSGAWLKIFARSPFLNVPYLGLFSKFGTHPPFP